MLGRHVTPVVAHGTWVVLPRCGPVGGDRCLGDERYEWVAVDHVLVVYVVVGFIDVHVFRITTVCQRRYADGVKVVV